MKRILLNDITKLYGSGAAETVAVKDVSLTIEPGEFFFLLGPSGCGKTTLLRIIAGLTVPTAGRVVLGDRDVTADPVEKRHTAMVFQNYALWPHMTVQQNVEFGPNDAGGPRRSSSSSRWVRSPPASRTSFPAGSSSGWRWPGRWPPSRTACCWTSR